jgi:hypothetical protein
VLYEESHNKIWADKQENLDKKRKTKKEDKDKKQFPVA